MHATAILTRISVRLPSGPRHSHADPRISAAFPLMHAISMLTFVSEHAFSLVHVTAMLTLVSEYAFPLVHATAMMTLVSAHATSCSEQHCHAVIIPYFRALWVRRLLRRSALANAMRYVGVIRFLYLNNCKK